MGTRGLAAILMGLLACAAAEAQSLFKCVQPDGKVVYQDSKCDDVARQSTLRAPAPPPAKPLDPKVEAERSVSQAQSTLDAVIDVVAGFSICTERVRDFGSKYGPAYEDWRKRNAAGMGRFGSEPESARKLDQRLQSERAKPAGEDTAANCARIVAAIQPDRGSK